MSVAGRKFPINDARPLDYLYDSAYIVSGARDYARVSFKAAMGSAQLTLQPVYKAMFSEIAKFPRMYTVYYPNCRLPKHMDTSYSTYVDKLQNSQKIPTPDLSGKDCFKFVGFPKTVLNITTVSPTLHPPSANLPTQILNGKPKNKKTQSVYRESSAQTIPWQPDGKAAETCETTPEVLYLDKLEWGPGKPYRLGDLPADFHTTEIINKMRHARIWQEIAERGPFPRWMKKPDQIITDIETKDWIFREAEIDELQEIRLSLLHKLTLQKREKQASRTGKKLERLWENKKKEMEHKIKTIRQNRDREMRKLKYLHNQGGAAGLCQSKRAERGMGSPFKAVADPTSDIYAQRARNGYQAKARHAEITYNPAYLLLEDHEALNRPPEWIERGKIDLTKTNSGHALVRDPMKLCVRETKWSEEFLEKLHNDLKKARLGAGQSAGPLRILKPRRLQDTPRPATPEIDAVPEEEENVYQSALYLQKLIRGRAVQCLMYEGRTRAAELTEELKTTHGLQKEDKIRIAKQEAKARDYNAIRSEAEKKEDAIAALVDELCGGAVSAALDFLEKELRRLKEERRQHAFIMIALREKNMREAAEAGRRQKEEHRRREHDEIFKQILGVTQETVDSYLQDIIEEGAGLAAEEEAVMRAERQADAVDHQLNKQDSMSTAEQNEIVAELVQQFLLPSAHKAAAQHRIMEAQRAKLEGARKAIFGLLDEAEDKEPICNICGTPLKDKCRCRICPVAQVPTETELRHDPRWKAARAKKQPKPKTKAERFPLAHEFRCMVDTLIDEVVVVSRENKAQRELVRWEYNELFKTKLETELEARDIVKEALDIATGEKDIPIRERPPYHHFSRMIRGDAIARTEPVRRRPCPDELPSEIRRKAEEKAAAEDGTCRCKELDVPKKSLQIVEPDLKDSEQRMRLLPTALRALEELKKCKCDDSLESKESVQKVTPVTTITSDSQDWDTLADPDEEDVKPDIKKTSFQ